MPRPRALIIAGPNGAGKTTFAARFLVGEWACENFINADLIAAGVAPFRPEDAAVKAMRFMADLMHSYVAARKDFAVESTLSGRTYAKLIREWKHEGYVVKIAYLRLDTVDLAIARVRIRAQQGGHDVPADVIRRRFAQGWDNFQRIYRPLVDTWQVFDASGPQPVLLAQGENK